MTCTRTFDVPLDLKLSEIEVPDILTTEIAIPEEVNVYLRDQLEQSRRQNEDLKRQLEENKREGQSTSTNEISTKQKCDSSIFNEFPFAAQLANSKIAELSKKLREKSSEIEVYRSKCTKLENHLVELKKQSETDSQIKVEKPVDSSGNEFKKLQDKLSHIKNKWAEEKSLNSKLKNDLKLANKWLQQEIGDSFETLVNFNNNNASNWRGRAQIIQDLQQKNQDLKEKLKTNSAMPADISPPKIDKKIEILSKENHNLKNNFEHLKRKYDASKARCRSLEIECALLKKKLTEDSERDQQLIASLTAQITAKKQAESDDLKQKEVIIKNLQIENENLIITLEKERCALENKSKELEEKSQDVAILNKRIRSARPQSSYIRKNEKSESKVSPDPEISRLEAERLRLLELTEIQNKRLEEERNVHMKTQNVLRFEKQKGAKLEASLARLELEQQNSYRSGYSSKTNSSTKQDDMTLKDKLELAEENIKALTTRLELEIYERKSDLQEFTRVLKNYTCETF